MFMEVKMGFLEKAKEASDVGQKKRLIGPKMSPEEIAKSLLDNEPAPAPTETKSRPEPEKSTEPTLEPVAEKPRVIEPTLVTETDSRPYRLGSAASFEGELRVDHDIEIDGRFKGSIDVSKGQLTLGENAKIEADVSSHDLELGGEIVGNVKAMKTVRVLSTGRLRGELETPSLMLEKGALIEGKIHRG
jgi:cytoskeletal protein CcmA (bactofilin family)